MSRNSKYNYNENMVVVKFDKAEVPKFTEKKGTERYVEFGEKNNYPEYLIGLFNESPKHGAIVKGKINYIYGRGFDTDLKANTKQSWNDIFKRSVSDDELYGGYYLMLVPDRTGRIANTFNVDFNKVRIDKKCSKFWVKNDWNNNAEKARIYPAYQKGIKEACIIFIKQYNPYSDVYPLPNYYQGLNYIESDIQVSRHILGNAKQGFVATTLINLNNGEPIGSNEEKAEIERGIKKKFTGSEGERFVLAFNKSKENEVSINQLGQTMLTKEDFTNINNLIQQEIFACHQITSPMLFGIKSEGQLGGRNEIIDAYEIFNNTYVNERQQQHEYVFKNLMQLQGNNVEELNIRKVEPLGFSLSEEKLFEILPKQYFFDKLGIDKKYYTGNADPSGTVQMQSNDTLINVTGRQQQQLLRIVRLFTRGQLTKAQASIQLKGFGLDDNAVNAYLGVDDDSNTEDFSEQLSDEDTKLIQAFSEIFEDADQYEVLASKHADYKEYFEDVKKLSELQSNVLNLISKDGKITAEIIASTLNEDVNVVSRVISDLIDKKLLTVKIEKQGTDEVIKRELTKPINKIPKEQSTVTDILLRYKYTGPEDDRNRPFCAKMLELSKTKMWSRSDIERISERLGYSVWDRRGGWFTQPNGEHRPYCRHSWTALTVIRKK